MNNLTPELQAALDRWRQYHLHGTTQYEQKQRDAALLADAFAEIGERMKTQRLRIPCVVCRDGTWCAFGGGGPRKPKDTAAGEAEAVLCEEFPDGSVVWIEADVPFPEAPTVNGRVVE